MKKNITDSIQFGEGNFLRAFVDYCIQILNDKTSFSGKVNIIQPLPKGMIEQLKIQNVKSDEMYFVQKDSHASSEEIQ